MNELDMIEIYLHVVSVMFACLCLLRRMNMNFIFVFLFDVYPCGDFFCVYDSSSSVDQRHVHRVRWFLERRRMIQCLLRRSRMDDEARSGKVRTL